MCALLRAAAVKVAGHVLECQDSESCTQCLLGALLTSANHAHGHFCRPPHTSTDRHVVNMQATLQWIGKWRANAAPPNAAGFCFRQAAVHLGCWRWCYVVLQAWACLQAFLNIVWDNNVCQSRTWSYLQAQIIPALIVTLSTCRLLSNGSGYGVQMWLHPMLQGLALGRWLYLMLEMGMQRCKLGHACKHS